MFIIDNTLISEDILEKHFICDLNKCKGACCVEGDYGAPLEQEEIEIIENNLEHIKPFMPKENVEDILKRGFYESDIDSDLVTTCQTNGECNFSFRDDKGILKCAIEAASNNDLLGYKKPISCHLYPIRVAKIGGYYALNYHKWEICKPACELGKERKVAVYQFLKNPLVRRFGIDWYTELEQIAEQFAKPQKSKK